MRRLPLLVFLCVLSLTACNKNKIQHVDANAAVAAEAAERHLGPEEQTAREHIYRLSEILQDNLEDGERAEARVEAYLHLHRDELIRNARALEATLKSKTGNERVIYEESFSYYMAPALRAWYDSAATLSEKHSISYRRIDRAMKNMMNRNTGVAPGTAVESEPAAAPAPAPAPAPETAPATVVEP